MSELLTLDLSVITVTWNAAAHIKSQVNSVIAGCTNISFEQIIVDNGSSDETLKILTEFPNLKIIKNNTNAGFGRANNQGAQIARGRYLLFLNPDMQVEPGSLAKIIAWFSTRPEVGIASCKLLNPNGTLNLNATPRRFPTVLNQLSIIFKLPHLLPNILNTYLYRDKNFNSNQDQEVDSVRGAFLLMRRELYNKLGFAFDPRYYLWFEDVDTCHEAWKNHFKVVYTPIISCVDYVGQSFVKLGFFWKQRIFVKSMIQYFLKWR